MTPKMRQMVAKEIIRAAKCVAAADAFMAQDEEAEEVDQKFVELIRNLRPNLRNVAPFKNKKLSRYGLGPIKATDTVEDLVRALAKIASPAA